MITEIITIASAGLISSKIFRCMDKKDYADIIKLCTWVGIGIAVLPRLNHISDGITNGWLAHFINWLISLFSYK